MSSPNAQFLEHMVNLAYRGGFDIEKYYRENPARLSRKPFYYFARDDYIYADLAIAMLEWWYVFDLFANPQFERAMLRADDVPAGTRQTRREFYERHAEPFIPQGEFPNLLKALINEKSADNEAPGFTIGICLMM